MDLIKIMLRYPDQELAVMVMKSFSRHLWYLSEDLVSLAFFDDWFEEKNSMLEQLSKPGKWSVMKRLEGKEFHFTDTATLSSYVTPRSKHLFQLWMDSDVDDVQELIQDETLSRRVKALKVISNSAESAIALIRKFNSFVKDETQKKFLIQITHYQHQMMPKRTKAACSSYDVQKK